MLLLFAPSTAQLEGRPQFLLLLSYLFARSLGKRKVASKACILPESQRNPPPHSSSLGLNSNQEQMMTVPTQIVH